MRLRFLTWNTLYGSARSALGDWEARAPMIVSTVLAEQPDAIALQEIDGTQEDFARAGFPGYSALMGEPSGVSNHPRLIRALAPFALLLFALVGFRLGALPWPFGAALLEVVLFTFALLAPAALFLLERYRGPFRDPGEFLPILHRADRLRRLNDGTLWFSGNPHKPRSSFRLMLEPRIVHWATFEAVPEGTAILVINAHLGHAPWHHEGSAEILLGIIAQHRPGPNAPVFLMGDFNATASSGVMRRLAGPGALLRDSWGSAESREGAETTFRWDLVFGTKHLRLDHVLIAGPAVAVTARVLAPRKDGRAPSDHDPLVVDVGL